MKVVKPSAEILKYEDPYELIEKVGRVCYKSEDMITEGSAKKFVKGLMDRHHYAMIEHSNVIISVDENLYKTLREEFDTTYLRMTSDKEHCIISGSFRAFRDMFLKEGADISFLACKLYYKYPLMFEDVVYSIYDVLPTEDEVYKFRRAIIISEDTMKEWYSLYPEFIMEHIVHTVRIVCDRGVTHELVRHRPASFAQESTRYCNYSKDKFGKEITFIDPSPILFGGNLYAYTEWIKACEKAEESYFNLIELGAKPEEARSVLPNSLKTEIVVTATETEWQHIIDLRYLGVTGPPHPQIKEVMGLVINELVKESRTILYDR